MRVLCLAVFLSCVLVCSGYAFELGTSCTGNATTMKISSQMTVNGKKVPVSGCNVSVSGDNSGTVVVKNSSVVGKDVLLDSLSGSLANPYTRIATGQRADRFHEESVFLRATISSEIFIWNPREQKINGTLYDVMEVGEGLRLPKRTVYFQVSAD